MTAAILPLPLAGEGAIAAHRAYLVRFASRRVSDAALVEDLVQETLLAALQGGDGFRQEATLRTWLTGILQRRIADAVRRRYRMPVVATPAAIADPEDDDAPPAAEPVDGICPARRLEGRQFLRALAACLAALPPRAERLFTLREIDGLSNEEAAGALGLDPRGCALLMHRVRERLRAELGLHRNLTAIRPG